MPIVGVNRDKLFEALGKTYSELFKNLASITLTARIDADFISAGRSFMKCRC